MILRLVKSGLTRLDDLIAGLLAHRPRASYGPVFIVGPPRSGTTLLYQLLVHCLDVQFVSNFQARFHYALVLGAFVQKLAIRGKAVDFHSSAGRTAGWRGPSEAGALWYRWFPREPHAYAPAGTLAAKDIAHLRIKVLGRCAVGHGPLVLKNVYHSVRVGSLAEAFPSAVFIICSRNRLQIARSILAHRSQAPGGRDAWWSVPPPDIDALAGQSYHDQIAGQVVMIYRQLEADRRAIGDSRFLEVSYESLCADPAKTLDCVREFLERQGLSVTVCKQPPPSFTEASGRGVPFDDLANLRIALDRKEAADA